MTTGLRNSRYASRRRHDADRYSRTVSVLISPTPRRSRSPAVAWWIAWLWRQLANDSNTSTPSTFPNQALARLDGRNEPCAQSWKTMYVRSRKPAAGTASASVSTVDTSRARYIAAHSTR